MQIHLLSTTDVGTDGSTCKPAYIVSRPFSHFIFGRDWILGREVYLNLFSRYGHFGVFSTVKVCLLFFVSLYLSILTTQRLNKSYRLKKLRTRTGAMKKSWKMHPTWIVLPTATCRHIFTCTFNDSLIPLGLLFCLGALGLGGKSLSLKVGRTDEQRQTNGQRNGLDWTFQSRCPKKRKIETAI